MQPAASVTSITRPVVVVGSINADLLCTLDAVPAPGETVLATDLHRAGGGKGANQAVAVARFGGRVRMVGRVGDDDAGAGLIRDLAEAGVDTTDVVRLAGVPSGTAIVMITPDGQNHIVVVSGANAALTPGDIRAHRDRLAEAALVVTQLEIPLETVAAVIDVCADAGVPTLLNLAPAAALPANVLERVDTLVVNEHEARFLIGTDVEPGDAPGAAVRRLRAKGPRRVALTLGAAGAAWCEDERVGHVPAPAVAVVDTTGAGDAFVGALAASMADGDAFEAAVHRAVLAGSEATTVAGARLPAG